METSALSNHEASMPHHLIYVVEVFFWTDSILINNISVFVIDCQHCWLSYGRGNKLIGKKTECSCRHWNTVDLCYFQPQGKRKIVGIELALSSCIWFGPSGELNMIRTTHPGNLPVRLANQRKVSRKFNLRSLATTCRSVWPGLKRYNEPSTHHFYMGVPLGLHVLYYLQYS